MSIKFLDLKPQYQALKAPVNERLQTILEHGQFINGPEVKECETALSTFSGAKHSVACSNGTDALVMALMAIDIQPGDEVITTPFSFIATAESIVLAGGTPVFVDIDPVTFNIDDSKIEAAITPKTKAIIPVSLFGLMPDLYAIQDIANKHGLQTIEDAAQSFGAELNGKRSCSISDISCTSFFPAKPLGGYGDGGAVFTNNDELHKNLDSIRSHGQGEHRYIHKRIGINGRLDSIQCAIVLEKLTRFEWELEQRNSVAKTYNQAFLELEGLGIKTPHIPSEKNKSAWAQYTLRVPNRDQLQEKLKEKGVPTAVYYPLTMFDHEPYKVRSRAEDIAHAKQACSEVMSLPIYPDLPSHEVEEIIKAVIECSQATH